MNEIALTVRSVKAFRTSTILRCVAAVVVLLSWLVLTNHCALGRLQSTVEGKAMHAHCHAMAGDHGRKAPTDALPECCQSVKANLPATADVNLAPVLFLLETPAVFEAAAGVTENPLPDFARDHGPPRVISFAETVLQRSLLSHAPPIFI